MKTLDEKVEHIIEVIHNIDKTLDRNTASLELHMKRTDLLEKKLEPVEKHVAAMNGAFKLLGVLSLLVGMFATIYKVFGS